MKQKKLAIIGVGHVGAYVLADAMKMNLFSEIVVIDKDKDLAHGEALDQAHATALTYIVNTHVYACDYEYVIDADVNIVAAVPSVIVTDDHEQLLSELLKDINSEVIHEIITEITTYTKDSIIILITNP